jgi:hypothetical protein
MICAKYVQIIELRIIDAAVPEHSQDRKNEDKSKNQDLVGHPPHFSDHLSDIAALFFRVILAAISTTPRWSPTSSLPLDPFQLYCHKVARVGALHFYGISLPPGHTSAELEGLQVGEDLVVKKSTKPSRIMAAYLEALAHCMPGAAISFNIGYSCYDLITQFWIFCHFLATLIQWVHLQPD